MGGKLMSFRKKCLQSSNGKIGVGWGGGGLGQLQIISTAKRGSWRNAIFQKRKLEETPSLQNIIDFYYLLFTLCSAKLIN